MPILPVTTLQGGKKQAANNSKNEATAKIHMDF